MFEPFQYRPLIEYQGEANGRILVCDETGLGKTIETGYILVEEYAAGRAKNHSDGQKTLHPKMEGGNEIVLWSQIRRGRKCEAIVNKTQHRGILPHHHLPRHRTPTSQTMVD